MTDIERAALGVKAWLAEHTGFGSEYDGDFIVAAYYGGHWIPLDCVGIARAALAAAPNVSGLSHTGVDRG